MRTQLAVASVLGVAIWSLIAVQVEPTPRRSEVYKPAPATAALVVTCEDKQIICRGRKRMEKVKANYWETK